MFKRLAVGLAVLICWVPVQVFALGLGNIEMRSALNQALDARIELLRARPGELKDLSITLASAETFKRAGMDRPAFLTQLRFEIITNPDGAPYIQVKSAQPITEPFLNFLIEVNWPNGRLLREFTVLVDPPVLTERTPGAVEAPVTQALEDSGVDNRFGNPPATEPLAGGAIEVPVPPQRAKPPAPAVAPPVRAEQPTETERAAIEAEPAAPVPDVVAKSRPRPRATRTAPPKPVQEAPAATTAEGETEYRVKANETLWAIAGKIRPSNAVSVPQMMIALLQDNPEAFVGNNINNLKQGAVLRLSDVGTATSISKDEAMRITDLQWDQWKSSRGTTVGSTPSRTGRPKAVAPPVEARVKLVSPNVSGDQAGGRNAPKAAATGGGRDPAQAKQELAIAQESLDAQRRETQDMRERVAGLEEQVNTMQRLVQLKDDQLAALQNQAKKVKKPEAAVTKAAESDVDAKGEGAKSTEAATEAPRSSGLMAGLMNDPKLIGLAVVVAGIVVLLVWLVVRRRKMQQFQESILTLNDSVAEPGALNNKSESEDASFMSDFAVSSMEGIQTDIGEVDPLSEADVYLAYGRYKQAEELVSQAIEKNPQRAELKMKLLEIHFAAKDSEAFSLQADMVRDNFSAKRPEMWARVLEMGREIAPRNPLFGGAGGAPNRAAQDTGKAVDEFDLGDLNFDDNNTSSNDDLSLDFDLPGSKTTPAAKNAAKAVALDETVLDFDLDLTLHDKKHAAKPAVDEQSLDFDLGAFDEAEKKAASTPAKGKDEGLDFDFSAFEQPEEKPVTAAATQAAAPAASLDDGLDFDFGAGTQTTAKPTPVSAKRDANVVDFNAGNVDDTLIVQPSSQVAFADSGIDGELDDALFADVDEIGTKLDLAKAYIDMGDSEGARSILDEVIEEGNANQKQEAQVLMRQIV